MILETERCILRRWKEEDKVPFANMNGDPDVMKYLPKTLSREESDEFYARLDRSFNERGIGRFAVERKDTGEFIGFVGPAALTYEAFFTPGVEIAWRLAKQHWNQGFATECARACLGYCLDTLGLEKVYSMTSIHNHASERVMEKLGLKPYEPFHFFHPKLEKDHWLAKHVLYVMYAEEFSATSNP